MFPAAISVERIAPAAIVPTVIALAAILPATTTFAASIAGLLIDPAPNVTFPDPAIYEL